jgi:prolipoprotein diacylglyceryltransferase
MRSRKYLYITALVFCALAILCIIAYMVWVCVSEEPHIVISTDSFWGKVLSYPIYMIVSVIGAILAWLLALARRNKYGLSIVEATMFSIILIFQAYFGAKLMSGIERVIDQGSFSAFDLNGQSFFGGGFLTILYAFLFAKITRNNVRKIYDLCAPCALLILAFLRTGCFITGCCGSYEFFVGSKSFYLPVQLFEVALDFALLAVLLYIDDTKLSWEKTGKTNKCMSGFHGTLLFITLVGYGGYRFLLEFLRDTGAIFLGLTFGQIHSITSITIGVFGLIILKKRYLIAEYERKRTHRRKKK